MCAENSTTGQKMCFLFLKITQLYSTVMLMFYFVFSKYLSFDELYFGFFALAVASPCQLPLLTSLECQVLVNSVYCTRGVAIRNMAFAAETSFAYFS